MKFRISVSDTDYGKLKEYLEGHGIEIAEDAEYVISENTERQQFITVRDEDREKLKLPVNEIIFLEAYGKEIEIHTQQGTYTSGERMYQLEEMLDPKEFIRISKSVIVSRKHIKRIRPTLSMKYVLTLSDGTLADVTRSYYSDFRREFNI